MSLGKEPGGSDVERDASRVTSLPPARVQLPTDSHVIQVACGLHHTGILDFELISTPFFPIHKF